MQQVNASALPLWVRRKHTGEIEAAVVGGKLEAAGCLIARSKYLLACFVSEVPKVVCGRWLAIHPIMRRHGLRGYRPFAIGRNGVAGDGELVVRYPLYLFLVRIERE